MGNPIFEIERCKGCKLCTSVCPKGIVIIDEINFNSKGFHPATVKDVDSCIGCAFCAMICPDCVIEVQK
jgi:2-oxoglutarate ferredoxin oxidoreductase subunit delta